MPSDQELRDLERRAASGEPGAALELARVREDADGLATDLDARIGAALDAAQEGVRPSRGRLSRDEAIRAVANALSPDAGHVVLKQDGVPIESLGGGVGAYRPRGRGTVTWAFAIVVRSRGRDEVWFAAARGPENAPSDWPTGEPGWAFKEHPERHPFFDNDLSVKAPREVAERLLTLLRIPVRSFGRTTPGEYEVGRLRIIGGEAGGTGPGGSLRIEGGRSSRNPGRDEDRRRLRRASAAGEPGAALELARLEEEDDGAALAFDREVGRLLSQANGHALSPRIVMRREALDHFIAAIANDSTADFDWPDYFPFSLRRHHGVMVGGDVPRGGRALPADMRGLRRNDLEVIALAAILPEPEPSEFVLGVNLTLAGYVRGGSLENALAWTWPRGRIRPDQHVGTDWWRPSWLTAWARKDRTAPGHEGGVYGLRDRVRVPLGVARRWAILKAAGDL